MANWIKVTGTNGDEYIRSELIAHIKVRKLGTLFELYNEQGNLLTTLKGDPQTFIDDFWPVCKPGRRIGFS